MRVLIASTYVPFIKGGGTKIVEDLHRELNARGFEADTVNLPFYSAWPAIPEQTLGLRLLDLSETSGNRIDRLITIRYPSYALRHPNKVAWFIHHHREAYDLWGTPWSGMPDNEVGNHYREMMFRSDKLYLGECRKVFTNSKVVAGRLKKFNDLTADGVLYPPLPDDGLFRPGPYGDYLFYPSRLTPIKRQKLAIEAVALAHPDLRLVIGGTADVPAYEAELHAMVRDLDLVGRVTFTGWISEERKAELMAGCRAALYLAYDEDSYGYVTLEAFHSAKAVVTLTDSGGSLEVIEDGHNGLVCAPDARALADALDRLWKDAPDAERIGRNALGTLRRYRIDWDNVVENLTS
jgi:glycosyltransferase involved in cell wall biosynthesis